MNGTRSLRVEGAVVFWSAGATRKLDLLHVYESLGLEAFMPGDKTPEAALLQSLKVCLKRHKGEGESFNIIPRRNRKKDGFEVQRVVHGKVNEYHTMLIARAGVGGPLLEAGPNFRRKELKPDHWSRVPSTDVDREVFDWCEHVLRPSYAAAMNHVEGAAVGRSLVNIVDHLDGLTLKDAGGVYWVPSEAVPMIMALREGLEDTVAIDVLENKPTVEAIDAFRRALTREIETEVQGISEDINSGDLGERALENRAERARELITKISSYEGILGTTLETLRDSVDVPKQAAATALAMIESGNQFESVFSSIV
tara:strand:- start:716 stop:1648 length:933 start_codon:yes stop_codon:yes gene_type:complete